MSRDQDMPLLDVAAFGAEIAALRKARKVPQDKLAMAAGISRVQLQNLEKGVSDRAKRTPANPRLSTLAALCQALGARVIIDVNRPTGFVIEVVSDGT